MILGEQFLRHRQKIYDRFHDQSRNFGAAIKDDPDPDRYAAYYTSMYLLQDSIEAIDGVVAAGLSNQNERYRIEILGILQAAVVAQDALAELYWAITGERLSVIRSDPHIVRLRCFRNVVCGHPARQGPKGQPPIRSFWHRLEWPLTKYTYESFDSGAARRADSVLSGISYPNVDILEMMRNAVDVTMTVVMADLVHLIDQNYPNKDAA